MNGPISQDGILMCHHPLAFKFQLNLSNCMFGYFEEITLLQLPIPYCVSLTNN